MLKIYIASCSATLTTPKILRLFPLIECLIVKLSFSVCIRDTYAHVSSASVSNVCMSLQCEYLLTMITKKAETYARQTP